MVAELEKQPKDIRAKFKHIIQLIEVHGLESVREPYIKHLEAKLWEMRMKCRDSISRAIYVTAFKKRIIILRVFSKKSQKTPRQEIKIALERSKEINHE